MLWIDPFLSVLLAGDSCICPLLATYSPTALVQILISPSTHPSIRSSTCPPVHSSIHLSIHMTAPQGSATRPGANPPCTFQHPAPTEGSRVALRCLACPPGIVVTHPLLAAAAGQAHLPGVAAPEAWGAHTEAQRRAAHCTVHTRAVVFAVGLEGLAISVAHPVQDTAHADHLCERKHSLGQALWVGMGGPDLGSLPPLDGA